MQHQDIRTHVCSNGLTLIHEPMNAVKSAAFSLLVPGGSVYDPPGKNGSASVLCDMLMRGAGDYDNRQLTTALDNLGVSHREHAGNRFMTFSGASLAANMPAALEIIADVVRRPHLTEEQFEPARAVVAQGLQGVEDEPRQKIMIELRRHAYNAPWGLPNDGTVEELENLTPASPREHLERCFHPDEVILAVAGNVEFAAVRDLTERLFGDWPSGTPAGFEIGERGAPRRHIEHDSEQTHIGLAWDSVPYRDPGYYAAWAAVGVLSGGMSARLFTEVREKRGLCYAIYASHNSLRDEARVLGYAGTTNDRAQETLDVTLSEIKRLSDGIEEDELARCKARAKSALVMQQESTMRRAGSMAGEWFHMGRVRSLDEISDRIDALTTDDVRTHLAEHPADMFTILTLGPSPLETPPAA